MHKFSKLWTLETIKENCSFDGECWEWMGTRDQRGYGMMSARGKTWRVSRFVMFLQDKVKTPSNIFACHTCDNPKCVNPAHLFWSDNSGNQLDSVAKKRNPQSKKTHCPQGHEYNEENTLWMTNKTNNRPYRMCRTCCRSRDLLPRKKEAYEGSER